MASIPKELLTITLNGSEYAVDPEFGEVTYIKSAQSQFVEQDREVFWTSWAQRSFHNGERLPYVLSREDLTAFRYHDGEGVDVGMLSDWGEVKVQPALARSLAVQSATMPMAVSSTGTTLLVGLTASPWVKIWTVAAGWVSASSGLSAAVTDLLAVGTTFYAVSGGKVYSSTNAGDTWAEVTAPSFTTAVGVAYANGDLYVLSSGSGVHNHTQNESVSTIIGSFIAGYRENVYWGADSRLYLYNGRSVTLYDQLPSGFIMTALIPYRGVLFILGYFKVRGGKLGAVYYLMQGTENHLVSFKAAGDVTSDFSISAVAGYDDEMFLANGKRGGADRFDLTDGGIAAGPATGTAMGIPFKSMAICEGYLWVGRYDASGHAGTAQATGNDTTHTKLAAGASASNDAYNGLTIEHTGGTGAGQSALISDYDGTTKIAVHAAVATPADDTTTYVVGTDGIYQADLHAPSTYRASGWLSTPAYDFDYPNQQKLFRDIRVEHKALTTGQSIVVAYSLDMGASWVTAITSNTVGATNASATLSNIKGNSIKLKATLTSGASATTTPTLTKLVVRAAPVTEAKYLWRVKLLIVPQFGGNSIVTNIETAYAAQAQLSFTDVDEDTANVIISDCQIVRRPSKNNNVGYVMVELREV